MARETLGQFEQLVMTAILALADNAYGVTIHAQVETLAQPKSVSLGAVYATLDRLEDKGLITSWLSDPTPERGGPCARSTKAAASASRRGATMPRSVTRPVTRRAGVTSKP